MYQTVRTSLYNFSGFLMVIYSGRIGGNPLTAGEGANIININVSGWGFDPTKLKKEEAR